MGGPNGTDSRDAWELFAGQCDCDTSDGQLDTAGRILGAHRHKRLRQRLRHRLTGQKIEHWVETLTLT